MKPKILALLLLLSPNAWAGKTPDLEHLVAKAKLANEHGNEKAFCYYSAQLMALGNVALVDIESNNWYYQIKYMMAELTGATDHTSIEEILEAHKSLVVGLEKQCGLDPYTIK